MAGSFRRTILGATILAATVPAALTAIVLLGKLRQELRQDALANLEGEARGLAAGLDRQVELIAARAEGVAQDSDVRRAAVVPLFISKADEILQRFRAQNGAVGSVYYVDSNGHVITAVPYGSELDLPTSSLTKLGDLAAQTSLASKTSALLEQTQAAASPGLPPGLLLRIPVTTLRSAPGAASLILTLPWEQLTASLRREPAAVAIVQDGPATKTAVWVRPDGDAVETNLVERRVKVWQAAPAPAGGLGLVLIAGRPDAEVFSAAHTALLALILAATAGGLFLALAALGFGRRLLQPLDALREYVAAYARGAYDTPAPALKAPELREITALLQTMAKNVQADLAATERRAAFQTEQVKVELETLKSQLKPHVLFNALNSIAAVAHERGPETVPLLTQLADLYRLILHSSRQVTQPLSAELAIVGHYLALEQLRLGDRLNYTVTATGVDESTPVPCLLLQTLVENAVRHGVAAAIDGGSIELTLVPLAEGAVAVTLVNTGQPLKAGYQHGTGLRSTIRRLDLLYADRHGFRLERGPLDETRVWFVLGRSR